FLTYLGGSVQDMGQAVGVDSGGNIWVGGVTSSTDFPLASDNYSFAGGYWSPFLAEVSNDGTKVLDATLVGTTFGLMSDLEIDNKNNVYVIGYTGQAPSTPGTYPPNPAVYIPAFVQKWTTGTPPSLSFSANSLGFETTAVGASSAPQTLTIQNTGG